MDKPIIEQPDGTEQPGSVAETPQVPEAPTKGLHEMSREERRKFLDGDDSVAKAKSSKDGQAAESSTAPAEGETAAETAASTKPPASETGKPSKDTKPKTDHRFDELLTDRRRETDRANRAERERDELRQRLEALEKPKPDGKTPAPSAAASASDAKKPRLKDFEDIEQWEEATEAYYRELARAEAAAVVGERETQATQQFEQHQEMERVVGRAAERLQADEKAHPDLIEKVHPRLRQLTPLRLLPEGAQPNVDHFIKDVMSFDSDHPLQLHAFYSSEEGWKEWAAMRRMNRREIERTITRRDLSFAQSSTAATGAAVAPKTFTKAPAPSAKGAAKPPAQTDGAASAVQAGDFAAFQSEMDQREPETARRYGRRR